MSAQALAANGTFAQFKIMQSFVKADNRQAPKSTSLVDVSYADI